MNIRSALFLCMFSHALVSLGQTSGSVDTTFHPDESRAWIPQAVQPDGKVLVTDDEHFPVGWTIARLNPDGSYDPTFGLRGLGSRSGEGAGAPTGPVIVLQASGKIIVGMTIGNFVLSDGSTAAFIRLNSDGSLDSTFHYDGPAYSYSSQRMFSLADGGTLAGGIDIGPQHIDATGSVNQVFAHNLDGCDCEIGDVQPDGRILVENDWQTGGVARLLPDGSRDPGFQGLVTQGAVEGVWALPDKKILVHGTFIANGQWHSRWGRLNSDGSVDENFQPVINPFESDQAGPLVVQGDGKIVREVALTQGTAELVRFNSDGNPDSTFSGKLTPRSPEVTNAECAYVRALLLHVDGSFWVSAAFATNGVVYRNELLRLHGDLPVVRLSPPSFAFSQSSTVIRLQTDAADGRIVVLETASAVFADIWEPVATNALLNGSSVFNITGESAAKSLQRFYRAVLR
jgi:uncharacterized delta-60 repeat protein